jgi:hypothetical protein
MLFILLACAPETPSVEDAETEWIDNIEVTTSALVPAALEVRFSSVEDAVGWVEFGVGDADALTTPITEEGTEHVLAVIGNPTLTEVTMRAVIEVDGVRHESGLFTAQTGQNLPETPSIEITVNNYDMPESTTLLMSVFGAVNYVVMMDLDGNVTWSLAQGVDGENYGLGVMPVDGGLMYNYFEIGKGDEASIEHVDLLGNPLSSVDTPTAHHFFTVGSSGELAWLEEDIRIVNGTEIAGDVAMRRDAKGEESILFSHWDNFTVPQTSQNYLDWTHSNWIDWDADRESYLISNAFTNTIVEVDVDGEPLRIMGGPGAVDSEYVFGSENEAFEYPHGPHWADNGDLLVFSTHDKVSRVVRYSLEDEGKKKLHEVWSYGADEGYEALWLGEVQELPDGNILISWGSVGLLQIVTPEGELLWEASAPFQSFFNQTHVMSDPYTPWE